MARAGEATESEYSVRAVGRTGEGTNRGHRQASKRLFTLTHPSPAVRRMPVLAPYSLFNVISMPDIELREVEFDIEGPIVAVTESEAVRPPSQSDTRELTCWITTLEASVMAAEWSRIVFLGPSLPLDQAKAILPDAEFRPPIKRDDLTAIPAGSIVGIIDGLLAKSLAISPGEIRDAIDHGVHAYDAASMGALRAVASTRPSPTQLVHPEHQRLFRRIQIQRRHR